MAYDPHEYNKPGTYYDNMSAHKTQYQTANAMKDYEFKRENLISILN